MSLLTLGMPASLILLLLLLSHAAAGLGGGGDTGQWTAVTKPTPIFPDNHRRGGGILESASSSDINALAIPDSNVSSNVNIQRFASLPDRPSNSKNGPDKRGRFRPGQVTNLGPIPIENDDVLLSPDPSSPTITTTTTPSTTTTATTMNLVTSSIPRATKPTKITKSTVPSKHAAPEITPLLRQEPWVLPLLVLASLALIAMTTFEVFLLCRARRTAPSRRHLFLGQMLLLGVFMCASLAALQTATPTAATCAVTRFGVGLSYAIVFSSLLVKSVFLISLNGGVYLPAPYQALLLLFAVLIQVAVGSQWLLNTPPRVQQHAEVGNISPTTPRPTSSAGTRHVITASDVTPVKGPGVPTGPSVPLCGTAYSETLAALIYVVFLMGFVGVLAAKSRGIRENYRESTYIGLSVACCAPLWLGWALAGLALAPRHQDACVGFGLLVTAVVIFSLMFLPRGRQLAAMGRDGRYAEDGGEERFSSLSPSAVAGYSPSFFHFKPAPPQTLHPTKQGLPPGATIYPPHLMGADRVALVAPPPPPLPPSYPRILHYYPCLYYPPRYHPGLYMKPDDGNMYTTLEPTLSTNPNVFFQRSGVHPGMMY